MLARMHQKTRYNIRLAERKQVTVRPWDDLPAFGAMMQTTAARDQFGVHTPAYYARAYELCSTPLQECELLVAEFEGRPLAALMVFAHGPRAWYLYGASTDDERNRMPTYLLQWEAMRWARRRGCRSYDLWGVPDAERETLEAQFETRGDGLWGVYRFKRGFGGELTRSIGAWDYPAAAAGLSPVPRRARPACGGLGGAAAIDGPRPRPNGAVRWRHCRTRICCRPGSGVSSKPGIGWTAERLVWRTVDGRPAAAAQVLERRVRVPVLGLSSSVLYSPRGPLLDWRAVEVADHVLRDLHAMAGRPGVLQIKIDPDLPLGHGLAGSAESGEDPDRDRPGRRDSRRSATARRPSRSSSAIPSSST